jgi:glycerol-3-phosphate dehydrogenase (NAD(P)+)
MKITVLGAGAWGTALAVLLQKAENTVTLWAHDPALLGEIRSAGRNDRFLPGVQLAAQLAFEPDLAKATSAPDCIVVAVPSKAFREITARLANYDRLVVSVTKGIEYETGLTMSGILDEVSPRSQHAALSGPSFAAEVARGIPTAIVAASNHETIAAKVQALFTTPEFRVYTSTDVKGVELGGALKNVIAIAAGVGDGMAFGDNSKAALVTRAMAEIRRLGTACGAQSETFTGLSGLGDLMVTCFSKHSRNRAFGERVGKGEKAANVAASMVTIAEGYPSARAAYRLARKHNVITPIIDEVHAMLFEDKDVRSSVAALMSRGLKAED